MYQPRRYWARQAALQARPGHDGNSALYLPRRFLAHTPERRSRSEHPAQRLPMSTTSIIFGQLAAPKEGAKPLAHRGLAQPVRCRRRHQPRRPPLAKIKPGRPAPATGLGTAAGARVTDRLPAKKRTSGFVVEPREAPPGLGLPEASAEKSNNCLIEPTPDAARTERPGALARIASVGGSLLCVRHGHAAPKTSKP
jgi:hypothetical protein